MNKSLFEKTIVSENAKVGGAGKKKTVEAQGAGVPSKAISIELYEKENRIIRQLFTGKIAERLFARTEATLMARLANLKDKE